MRTKIKNNLMKMLIVGELVAGLGYPIKGLIDYHSGVDSPFAKCRRIFETEEEYNASIERNREHMVKYGKSTLAKYLSLPYSLKYEGHWPSKEKERN